MMCFRVAKVRVEQEQRVNSLEARLQELSETVGTYDRLRQHDQVRTNKYHLDNVTPIVVSMLKHTGRN